MTAISTEFSTGLDAGVEAKAVLFPETEVHGRNYFRFSRPAITKAGLTRFSFSNPAFRYRSMSGYFHVVSSALAECEIIQPELSILGGISK